VKPGVAILSLPQKGQTEFDAHHDELRQILKRTTDARGRSIEIVEIPYAVDFRSQRPDFFSGYANYYVGNGALFTPQFGDRRTDEHAETAFKKLFPNRRIVSLDLDRIYENGGGAHCVTQQQPV